LTVRRAVAFVLAGLAAAGGVWPMAKLIWFRPANIDHFFMRPLAKRLLRDPELVSRLGVLEPYGIRWFNSKLTDASDEFERGNAAIARRELAVLRSYDRARLTRQQRLSADILDWHLDAEARKEPFLLHNYPVNQLFGIQSELPEFMATMHRIGDRRDARDYIARLSQFGRVFNQVVDGLKSREAKGIVPPTFVAEKTLEQMRGFVATPVQSNILFTAFVEKLDRLAAMKPEQKDGLRRAAALQLETTVYPAYRRLIAYFEKLQPKTTADAGVWKFPNGDKFYAEELRRHTTTEFSPEQVYELGLKEVARIEVEMRREFDALGYPSDVSIGQCLKRLENDPKAVWDQGAFEPDAALAQYRSILEEAQQRVRDVFDREPRAGIRVERIPQFKEKTAPAAYYEGPSLDGARPGIFFVNLFQPAASPRYEMKTLTYHEAIPGHHFQIALQQELAGLPYFQRLVHFTAYVEGWALYAERLAWECGLYDGDSYGNIGRLSFEQFRALRLVVDTGLHSKRWTREQAMAYMEEHTGSPNEIEVDRYIVNPGQACAYKIGELKILELRERARSELGERFSLKEFHNVVLENGPMPLDVLEAVVSDYIAARKAS
jgi:uncharacterized protein (DUF885 family)